MLTIEDGSGIDTANSYIDISFVESYLVGEKLLEFQSFSYDQKAAAIIMAVRYIDAMFQWVGVRKTFEQGLEWPRQGAEYQGFTIDGIPSALKRACAEAVALTQDNAGGLFSTDGNRVVTSVNVAGAVSESYAYDKVSVGKAAETKYEALNSILKGLYIPGGGASICSAGIVRA